jgi:predicted nicotinamide N-methyase
VLLFRENCIALTPLGVVVEQGYIIWEGAIVLARWLHIKQTQGGAAGLLSGQTVLDVSAGVGLCGLAAALHAREVVLTEYPDLDILRNIQ